jgi:hypothetical protein
MPMRRKLASLALVALVAACSAPQDQSTPSRSESSGGSADSVSAPAPATSAQDLRAGGPDVSPTAAPGVAFNYRYAFRLAGERIAEVQEQHARTCEQLGVNRCRITGMSYRLVGDREVQARLDFKLEPGLARRFGRAGIEAVQQAEGTLISSEIAGEDVGTRIAANTRSIGQLQEDLRRIEQQIADRNVADGDKDGLRIEAQRIREQIRAAESSREEQQETLATTPMTFEYGSGNYGSDRPDFAEAASNAWDGFLWGLYVLFVALVALLPWIVAGVLVWLAVRAVRRRIGRRPVQATPPTSEPVS